MEDLDKAKYTEREMRWGIVLGGIAGMLVVLVIVVITAFFVHPAQASPSTCKTTFTYNHSTGVVTVSNANPYDSRRMNRFRLVTDDGTNRVNHDYPEWTSAQLWPSSFSVKAPRNLWAITSWHGDRNCSAVLFGGLA